MLFLGRVDDVLSILYYNAVQCLSCQSLFSSFVVKWTYNTENIKLSTKSILIKNYLHMCCREQQRIEWILTGIFLLADCCPFLCWVLQFCPKWTKVFLFIGHLTSQMVFFPSVIIIYIYCVHDNFYTKN